MSEPLAFLVASSPSPAAPRQRRGETFVTPSAENFHAVTAHLDDPHCTLALAMLRSARDDLKSKNEMLRADALRFFRSETFVLACAMLCIDEYVIRARLNIV